MLNEEKTSANNPTPNIFILEDDTDIGYILNFHLTEEGYKIKLFNNVTEIADALKNGLPDLFLLDVMLPDGNGIDICNQIKKNSTSAEVPVLMMSANVDPLKLRSCACDAFIKKPFDLLDLSHQIKAQLIR